MPEKKTEPKTEAKTIGTVAVEVKAAKRKITKELLAEWSRAHSTRGQQVNDVAQLERQLAAAKQTLEQTDKRIKELSDNLGIEIV